MRKKIEVTIEDEGRDKGKVFVLTEAAARRSERWGTRLLLAMSKAGVDIPEDIAQAGLAGVAMLGIKALGGVNFDEAEALLDEMMTCVELKTSAGIVRRIIDDGGENDDIEELATRFRLRKEVMDLHVGFLLAVAKSKLNSTTPPAAS